MTLSDSEFGPVVVPCSGIEINKYGTFLYTANELFKRETGKNIEIFVKEILFFVVNLAICNYVEAVFYLGSDLIP